MQVGRDVLAEYLKSHPDLVDTFFPSRFLLQSEFYRLDPPTEYSMNVIFDPCRGFDYNCCLDTSAAPEFFAFDTNRESASYGEVLRYRQSGDRLPEDASRLVDFELFIDERCEDLFEPFERCFQPRIARTTSSSLARCWNHNTTIIANRNCRAPADGTILPFCMEVGITQTAYIVQCGGKFKNDPNCGTFLEIHRPGRREVLAQARLRGQFASGYRMTVISMTHKASSERVLCEGEHEMWWVQRSKHEWVVEAVLPFRIASPRCDWDLTNNRYQEYATISTAEDIFGLSDYDPNLFLFSRQRTTGRAGFPGKGMGSTLVLNASDGGEVYPASAEFDRIGEDEYRYRPVRDPLSVADGELWDWHKDENFDAQQQRRWSLP